MMRALLSPIRAVALSCGLFLSLAGALPHAAAQTAPPVAGFDRTRLIGEVANLQGPTSNPDSFSLQLGYLTVDLHITPNTTYVARSAEAQIEGLVNGDYAFVVTRRVRHVLIAFRIVFDVQPFHPLREFTGAVVRVSPDQMHLVMKLLDTTRTFSLRLTRQTRFKIDGRIADIPPALVKGEAIQIVALQRNGWIAFDVDVHPSTNGNRQFR